MFVSFCVHFLVDLLVSVGEGEGIIWSARVLEDRGGRVMGGILLSFGMVWCGDEGRLRLYK